MDSTELIRRLEKAGWVLARINGSHHVFKHPSIKGRAVVPHPRKDVAVGTVNAVLKLAKLK